MRAETCVGPFLSLAMLIRTSLELGHNVCWVHHLVQIRRRGVFRKRCCGTGSSLDMGRISQAPARGMLSCGGCQRYLCFVGSGRGTEERALL
ncbi:hypothetical protein M427DRAFT_409040 [Gonapodya prolifera JEL478]|uniref:Uncharacterized protein n=1 Tax=Gonapodya prolifera (strain JEL478) TaxID=1344416 RepID=A0A139A6Y8_GONPJ|nr:hypothetical protein M427DRAFT_409040 [Gonapodya prolifera JEL478]|eukprot:KXS12215.1 hypothetical protein M427DRAFT_409040 [Gonapodya prolifera JEL478]